MGNDGEVIYDNASAVLVEENAPQQTIARVLQAEQEMDSCRISGTGSFPNMEMIEWIPGGDDGLPGGEATYQAKFGAKANAVFNRFYWMPGEYEVRCGSPT